MMFWPLSYFYPTIVEKCPSIDGLPDKVCEWTNERYHLPRILHQLAANIHHTFGISTGIATGVAIGGGVCAWMYLRRRQNPDMPIDQFLAKLLEEAIRKYLPDILPILDEIIKVIEPLTQQEAEKRALAKNPALKDFPAQKAAAIQVEQTLARNALNRDELLRAVAHELNDHRVQNMIEMIIKNNAKEKTANLEGLRDILRATCKRAAQKVLNPAPKAPQQPPVTVVVNPPSVA